METSLISVIVPVFNAEAFLEECLESLKRQTYRNLEFWLVDDGSTDGSGGICDRAAEKDPRIHVIHQQNAGVSDARNTALEKASGKYIAFMDADDWAEPELYEKLLSGFETMSRESDSAETDIILSMCAFCLDQDRVFYPAGCREDRTFDGSAAQAFLLTDKLSALWDKLFLRERILEKRLRFCTDISMGEDSLFWFSYIQGGGSIRYLAEPLYHYRQSADSASRKDFKASRMSLFDALDKMTAMVPPQDIQIRDILYAKEAYSAFVSLIFLKTSRIKPSNEKELQKKLQKRLRNRMKPYLRADGYTKADKAAGMLVSVLPSLGAKLYQVFVHA